MATEQNARNHARYVPGFHFLAFGLVMFNLVVSIRGYRPGEPWAVQRIVLAVALLLVTWYARAFAVGVQDRVIRLEMRLRVKELVPALAARFDELTVGQVVALRFAGDDELPALMQRALDGELAKPAAIKAAIRHWKADTHRV